MTKRSAITVRSWMSRTTTSSAFASEAASARIRASVVGSIANSPFVPRLGKLLQVQYKRSRVYVQPCSAELSRSAQDSRAGLGGPHDTACCTTATYIAVAWWAWKDLNLRPGDYESLALTPELQAHSRSRMIGYSKCTTRSRYPQDVPLSYLRNTGTGRVTLRRGG